MSNLVYRCPHCGASHELAESLIGDRVDCRSCGKPFEAAAPVATPVQSGDGEPASFRVAAGEGEVENPILVVHPVLIRKHPLRFLGVAIVLLAGIACIIAGLAGGAAAPGNAPPGLLLIAGAILTGLAATYWLVAWIETRFTSLSITNRRSVLRKGLFSRETSEVRHRDVRNLQVEQSAIERLLNVGDLAISSAGQDDLEIAVAGIPDPTRVAAVIRDMQ
jgi:hypothetical protein